MGTDYDALRRSEPDEEATESVEELNARRAEERAAAIDVDEADILDNFELPGADLSDEELTVRVIPKQHDEFTCARCFLVNHRSRRAYAHGDQIICRDCA